MTTPASKGQSRPGFDAGFIDSKGNAAPFAKRYIERLREGREALGKFTTRKQRQGADFVKVSEAAAQAALGSGYRRFNRDMSWHDFPISRDFRLRDILDDIPQIAHPWGGSEPRPAEIQLDPHGLGTYWEVWPNATGAGRITQMETYQNNATARMGGYVRGSLDGADDDDLLEASAESGFWWTHVPSRDCRIEVRGIAMQTYSRHYRNLTDEGPFQVSDCNVNQDNYLTTGFFVDDQSLANYGKAYNPVGPGSSYIGDGQNSDHFQDGWWDVTGYGSPDKDELVRNGNRTLEFRYRPTVSVAKGVPVHCFFGARSSFRATLDDVSAVIRQGGTWQLIRLAMVEV